jgi:hypothetical protein
MLSALTVKLPFTPLHAAADVDRLLEGHPYGRAVAFGEGLPS